MTDSEFHQLADEIMETVEARLERHNTANEEARFDVDYEVNGGTMNLEFDNGSAIVISRQEPLHEVWLATKKGGYHFEKRGDRWICNRSGFDFWQLLEEACSQQAGIKVELTDA
ncbi:iron donor protein CyaY [Pantoea sp. 1.19]|uniref:iron donor protein CyaY n=1 Tax=Pantoea sp. 1.19 TaxID=1925589 RepID=UPI000948F2BE|nr:iron donor protein CyaY [Pantoea sp. 1.19]